MGRTPIFRKRRRHNLYAGFGIWQIFARLDASRPRPAVNWFGAALRASGTGRARVELVRKNRGEMPRFCLAFGRGKKSPKPRSFPFDTPGPPPYIPAPQPLAGHRSCGRLCFSGIVKVRGRGTWAAAWSRPVGESLRANQSSNSERSRSSAIRHENSDEHRIFTDPEACPTPSC
jgi:hypothetical protein